MWSLVGIAASRVVGLLPWAGPRTIVVLLYGCLSTMVVGGPAVAVWLHMRGEAKTAVETCNAEWNVRLANAESEYAQLAATALIDAAVVDTRVDVNGIGGMCRNDANCRDRSKSGGGAGGR